MLEKLTSRSMAANIRAAKKRVVFLGAGISLDIAEAIKSASDSIQAEDIIILTDTSPASRRLGYGDHQAILELYHYGVNIYELWDVRLAFCVVDDAAWVFAQVPELIEIRECKRGINCIKVLGDEVESLANDAQNLVKGTSLEGNTDNRVTPLFDRNRHNASLLTLKKLNKITLSLRDDPPQHFDLSRKIIAFNSRLEFVELKLHGMDIKKMRFNIPKELKPILIENKDDEGRFSAHFKIFDNNRKLASNNVSDKVFEVREVFLKPIGNLGRLIKTSDKKMFENELCAIRKEIEIRKNELKAFLQHEKDTSIESLISIFAERVRKSPPLSLKAENGTNKLSLSTVKDYLRRLINKQIPSIHDMIGSIELKCTYKAITYEMLSDVFFQKKVRELFPHEEWTLPYDEITVARKSEKNKKKSLPI
ncbi:hypothetical protein [Endozoicomonas ascidiicola]|uniref:hypothetical protein n=1 Tax=Endozoicomonas ascidiicola TaxID=1698521 RepID=UPI0008372BD6|nr:hypothetical protein [Endozoicomonas ascidiicola]USN26989.1 hypothetical protein [synthetic construct]